MSKIYDSYLKYKNNDKNKIYLFKSGMFYIFVDEDATNISKIIPLKITNLTNDIVKCGFPVDALNRYKGVFENLKLDIEIVDSINNTDNISKIINKLQKLDINNITPVKSIELLQELKSLVDERWRINYI